MNFYFFQCVKSAEEKNLKNNYVDESQLKDKGDAIMDDCM